MTTPHPKATRQPTRPAALRASRYGAVALLGLATVLTSCGTAADPPPPEQTTTSQGTTLDLLTEGATVDDWVVRYNGHGSVYGTNNKFLVQPQTAKSDDITHAGLVHTSTNYTDAEFSVTLETQEQLRTTTPNTWEVGWVLWNYQDDSHFYAVALKPNGWEITKQDPDYDGEQRFLATGDSPTFPIHNDYEVAIDTTDNTAKITVDGQHLATVTDQQTPYTHGAVGLYTEDARVLFRDLQLPDATTSTTTLEDSP